MTPRIEDRVDQAALAFGEAIRGMCTAYDGGTSGMA